MAPQERRTICLRLPFVKPLRSEQSSFPGIAVNLACIARRPTHLSTCRLSWSGGGNVGSRRTVADRRDAVRRSLAGVVGVLPSPIAAQRLEFPQRGRLGGDVGRLGRTLTRGLENRGSRQDRGRCARSSCSSGPSPAAADCSGRRVAACSCSILWQKCGKWIAANGSVVANLPCNGEGSLEERLALIELRSQETHLPEKRVTFRRSKLKLGI